MVFSSSPNNELFVLSCKENKVSANYFTADENASFCEARY
jgi:hypothetical protein